MGDDRLRLVLLDVKDRLMRTRELDDRRVREEIEQLIKLLDALRGRF